MTISQFFVLSSRGDKIISRDFRNDITKESDSIFFRKVKFWSGDAPPAFCVDGINFIHIVRNTLYFVVTTRENISPNLMLEFLGNVCCRLIGDFVGQVTEDALRSNLMMVYEILDEIVDYGFIQTTSTEGLKIFVFNESTHTDEKSKGIISGVGNKLSNLGSSLISKKTLDSSVTATSIQDTGKRNDLFVDVIENVSAVFDNTGSLIRSEIIGAIRMKSFLMGQPTLRLGLNEDLIIGKDAQYGNYGSVRIDNCNFSDLVRLDEFQHNRVISLTPPNGQFTVMNYRITNAQKMPFRILPYINYDLQGGYKVEIVVKIRADFDKKAHGSKVLVTIPVPRDTSNAVVEFGVGSQTTYEYKIEERKIIWGISKFLGGTEQVIRIKSSLSKKTTDLERDLGPISMKFEMPMHSVSALQIKFLKFQDLGSGDHSKDRNRWVRYVSRVSSEYVCRMKSQS